MSRLLSQLIFLPGFAFCSLFASKEVAVFLDVPLSTVKGRLQQAQRRLRAMMASTETPVMVDEKEIFAMNKIDVSKDVQDIVCRIASQPVDQTVPLEDTRHLVFYCGIATEIDIRQQGEDTVRVTGTKPQSVFRRKLRNRAFGFTGHATPLTPAQQIESHLFFFP